MSNEENTYQIDVNAALDRQRAAECMLERELFLCRPSVMLRVSVAKDGNLWSALYGPNIMEGVCGWGETPDQACADFDRNWKGLNK